MNCKVLLRWDATPEQYRALGAALWKWCNLTAGSGCIYQYLNNQALADLRDGRLPALGPMARSTDLPHVYFSVWSRTSRDREGILESLRRTLPGEGVADVQVEGMSWCRTEENECPVSHEQPPDPHPVKV